MIFITCLASSGYAMKQFADTIADREEKQASSSIISINHGFEDSGDTFFFISERGRKVERRLKDYSLENQDVYKLVSKKSHHFWRSSPK